jgi:hypothetical protein
MFGASACSDPSNEPPVALKPGLYGIKIGSFGKAKEQLCFVASDAANLDRLVKKYYNFADDCSQKVEPRVGNQLQGSVQCPITPTMGWDTTYTASVGAEQLSIDARMVSYVVEGSPSKREETVTEGTITATRVGNC